MAKWTEKKITAGLAKTLAKHLGPDFNWVKHPSQQQLRTNHADRMVLGCAKQSKLESCVEKQFELRLLTDSSPHCSDADGKQELDGDAERHL